MCGRFASSQSVDDLLRQFDIPTPAPTPLEPDYNVAPTKQVYAVVERPLEAEGEPVRQLRTMRWGLVPSWAKDPSIGSRMINARQETIAEKPAYRKAFATRRCLLPADGYYEWYADPDQPKTKKQPYFIHSRDGEPLALAGIYEFWKDKTREADDSDAWWTTVAIITTSAPDDLGRIHERMPLLVESADWGAWLDRSNTQAADVRGLLVPAAPGRLNAYPVSRDVNSVGNNGPHLLDRSPPT